MQVIKSNRRIVRHFRRLIMEEVTMKDMLKGLLLVSVMLLSAGAMAEECNPSSKWWPYCNDPATGPDVGTPEHGHCQANGGCTNN